MKFEPRTLFDAIRPNRRFEYRPFSLDPMPLFCLFIYSLASGLGPNGTNLARGIVIDDCRDLRSTADLFMSWKPWVMLTNLETVDVCILAS